MEILKCGIVGLSSARESCGDSRVKKDSHPPIQDKGPKHSLHVIILSHQAKVLGLGVRSNVSELKEFTGKANRLIPYPWILRNQKPHPMGSCAHRYSAPAWLFERMQWAWDGHWHRQGLGPAGHHEACVLAPGSHSTLYTSTCRIPTGLAEQIVLLNLTSQPMHM